MGAASTRAMECARRSCALAGRPRRAASTVGAVRQGRAASCTSTQSSARPGRCERRQPVAAPTPGGLAPTGQNRRLTLVAGQAGRRDAGQCSSSAATADHDCRDPRFLAAAPAATIRSRSRRAAAHIVSAAARRTDRSARHGRRPARRPRSAAPASRSPGAGGDGERRAGCGARPRRSRSSRSRVGRSAGGTAFAGVTT